MQSYSSTLSKDSVTRLQIRGSVRDEEGSITRSRKEKCSMGKDLYLNNVSDALSMLGVEIVLY